LNNIQDYGFVKCFNRGRSTAKRVSLENIQKKSFWSFANFWKFSIFASPFW